MDSGEKGMNPVTMTIINPRTEHWPSRKSNQRPPVFKSCTVGDEARRLETKVTVCQQCCMNVRKHMRRRTDHCGMSYAVKTMLSSLLPVNTILAVHFLLLNHIFSLYLLSAFVLIHFAINMLCYLLTIVHFMNMQIY